MGESTPPHQHPGQRAALDSAAGVANSVGRRRAAGRDDVAHAAKSEAHGDFAGQRSDGGGGDSINAALFLVAAVVEPVLLFGELLRAAAGTDNHADRSQFVAGHAAGFHGCVGDGFARGGRAERNAARNVGTVLRLHLGGFVKTADFAGYLHLEAGGIEARDSSDTALAGPRGAPEVLSADAVGADNADSGDDHPITHF